MPPILPTTTGSNSTAIPAPPSFATTTDAVVPQNVLDQMHQAVASAHKDVVLQMEKMLQYERDQTAKFMQEVLPQLVKK